MGVIEKSTSEIMLPYFENVRKAPFNIAPERKDELAKDIFGRDKWELRASKTEANFYAVVEDRAIYVAYAGMASLWSLSYAAHHLMEVAKSAQRIERSSSVAGFDVSNAVGEIGVGNYISFARKLIHKDIAWGHAVKEPNSAALFDTVDGRINNIFYGALSFIILHEIGHVHMKHAKYVGTEAKVRQEYEADGFATSWILKDAGHGLQREFRVIMLVVALTWGFLFEQEKGRGTSHPPAMRRFDEAMHCFELGDRSIGYESAAHLLKMLFDPETIMPTFETPRDYFFAVVEGIRKIFPVD
jgi:hypothetical protein